MNIHALKNEIVFFNRFIATFLSTHRA